MTFWNLRASDIPLLFVDRAEAGRYAQAIPAWKKYTEKWLSNRRDPADRRYAIWWRRERLGDQLDVTTLPEAFGNEPRMICGVDKHLWNGRNIKPPMMHLGEVASLGVLVTEGNAPKISFSLNDRPYATDVWFHTQGLWRRLASLVGCMGEMTSLSVRRTCPS